MSVKVFVQHPLSWSEFFDGHIMEKDIILVNLKDVINLNEKDLVFKLYEETINMEDNSDNMYDQKTEVNDEKACVKEVVEVNEVCV